jgi:hypothetical protein
LFLGKEGKQMWYWVIEEEKNQTAKEADWSQFAMPTLLEALEEKYGYAGTSDTEAGPELFLLELRLPKRTPLQRWLCIAFLFELLGHDEQFLLLPTARQVQSRLWDYFELACPFHNILSPIPSPIQLT